MQPIHHDSDVPSVARTATSGIQLKINGQAYSVQVSPRRTLLDLLRDQLALTGTKKVCDMGHCGACTVLRDGTAVLSCLTLASACDGADIATVEGLAASDGTLSPLQQAFIDCDAFQCGFCTPGQLISATALLAENPTPSREDIQAYMAGNLCRCGAYSGIIDAIEQASRQG
ncbi:MAG: (2Fe-2S)-binding protein [Chloroflexota bacterium]|nr:(2Fe-2S)-binding protein [Chloroflexota bacterium]